MRFGLAAYEFRSQLGVHVSEKRKQHCKDDGGDQYRSFHNGVADSGCPNRTFMFLLPMNTVAQHLINTEAKKLHANNTDGRHQLK